METSPPSHHYRFSSVTDGVRAAIARPDGWGICNSGLVDLGDGTLLFDSGMTPASASELRREFEELFRGPPSVLANSHWHFDHSLGNQSFSGVPIWGTRRTREILLENHDQLAAELTRESLEKEIADLGSKLDAARSDTARRDVAFWIHMARALLAFAGTTKIAPPGQTFETKLDLPGSRGARLLSFGPGHTEADAVLFLPNERVLFAGDLVCIGVQPSLQSGDPRHWLQVLDELDRLRPEVVVPGHGPVVSLEQLSEARGYLTGVLAAAEAREGEPLPASIRKWEGTLSLEGNLSFARRWIESHPP